MDSKEELEMVMRLDSKDKPSWILDKKGIKVFLWLILEDKILSKENLKKRNWHGNCFGLYGKLGTIVGSSTEILAGRCGLVTVGPYQYPSFLLESGVSPCC
ncbi:hypothetical protein ACJX0J_027313 [Zea mays]